jgi:hypothetical protein
MQSKLVWYSVQEKLVVTESDTPIAETTQKFVTRTDFLLSFFIASCILFTNGTP